MIILGIGGILRRCRQRRSEGRRTGGRGRRSEAGAAPHAGAGAASCRSTPSRPAWSWPAPSRTQVDCVAVVRPLPRDRTSTCSCARSFPNSRIVLVEHHPRTRRRPTIPSPFDEATVLTLDRGGDFRCGSRWHGVAAPQHRRSSRSSTTPDSLGDLYGRVTELLGFDAERGRAQGAVALGLRRRPLPRPVPRDPRPGATAGRASTAPTSTRTPQPRRLQREVLRAARPGGRRAGPGGAARRTSPRASRRPSKRPCIRMAGEGREPVPRRRARAERAAGLGARERAPDTRTSSCSRRRAMPAPRSARCSTPGTAPTGTRAARAPGHLCLGPAYSRGRDQAGARELQAALPLPADHRRTDRHRGGAVEREQDRGLDARPHGVRPARARQPQHSGLAARIPTPPRT